jgi:hypothetical protein
MTRKVDTKEQLKKPGIKESPGIDEFEKEPLAEVNL